MYAVIETGGKQYKVQEGDTIHVERLDAEVDSEVTFDRVLAVCSESGITVGDPFVPSATVVAKVLKNGKGEKIHVFKYNAKKNYRKRIGHRQPFSRVIIEKINA